MHTCNHKNVIINRLGSDGGSNESSSPGDLGPGAIVVGFMIILKSKLIL